MHSSEVKIALKGAVAEHNHVLKIYVIYEIFPILNMNLSWISLFLRRYTMNICKVSEQMPLGQNM